MSRAGVKVLFRMRKIALDPIATLPELTEVTAPVRVTDHQHLDPIPILETGEQNGRRYKFTDQSSDTTCPKASTLEQANTFRTAHDT